MGAIRRYRCYVVWHVCYVCYIAMGKTLALLMYVGTRRGERLMQPYLDFGITIDAHLYA